MATEYVGPTAGISAAEPKLFPGQIPGLDGIRGISFLLVYFAHMGWSHGYTGGTGVLIFFFLSGYLVTTLLREELQSTDKISFRKFYIKRFFRIFPPYYTVLVIVAIGGWAHLLRGKVSFLGMLSAAAYLNNILKAENWPILRIPEGLSIAWSLCVEEHFYLFFPLLFIVLSKLATKWRVGILASICLACMLWRVYLTNFLHVSTSRVYLSTDTRIDCILFGCIMAIGFNPLYEGVPLWFKKSPAWLATVSLLGVFGFEHVHVFKEGVSYTLVALCLFPVFWYVVFYRVPWLEWPWLRVLGQWSYSLYLIHVVIIRAVGNATGLSVFMSAVCSFPISLLCGWAMARYIEAPSRRARSKILGILKSRSVHKPDGDLSDAGTTSIAVPAGLG